MAGLCSGHQTKECKPQFSQLRLADVFFRPGTLKQNYPIPELDRTKKTNNTIHIQTNKDSKVTVDCVIAGIAGAIAAKTVTYDLERLMQGGTLLSCSDYAQAVIDNM